MTEPLNVGEFVLMARGAVSHSSPPPDDSQHDDDDREHDQDVDEPAQRVRADETEQPQDDENDSDSFQHEPPACCQ